MSQNSKLYRNFIILNEDQSGYSISKEKVLSGYAKIQARGDSCKISFYAQNLREDKKYCMMLVTGNRDNSVIINLGNFDVVQGGKGEATREFNSSNVGGDNIGYDKIIGTAIVDVEDGSPTFVMYGFINGKEPTENWKGYRVVKSREETKDELHKDVEEMRVKQNELPRGQLKKSDKKKEKIKEFVQERKESTVHINEEDIECEKNIIDKEVEENKEDVAKRNFADYEKNIEDTRDGSSDFTIRGSVGEYFEGIAEGFIPYRDGLKEIKYCKWYKVDVKDLYEMCNMSNYNKYTVAYYPMLNYYPYIKKHGHFMLGYKCDKEGNLKYIVYGIPGKKDKDDQPYEGKTGFVTWVKDKDDDLGFWLMFYDYKNSTIVVPMQ